MVEVTTDVNTFEVDKAECFTHGQLYVALSRCGDPDEVAVYVTSERAKNRCTANVVHPDALLIPNGCETSGRSDTSPDVIDDDVVFEPRDHLAETICTRTLDVPWHGHVYEERSNINWNGDMSRGCSLHEAMMNISDHEANEFIDSCMSDSCFGE